MAINVKKLSEKGSRSVLAAGDKIVILWKDGTQLRNRVIDWEDFEALLPEPESPPPPSEGEGGEPEWLLSSPDRPPNSPNAKDDEFDGATLDAKWSWVNQGAATATLVNGILVLSIPATSGDNARIIEQVAPSTPWTITTRLNGILGAANTYNQAGLCLRNSSSGKIVKWDIGFAGPAWRFQLVNMNSATAYAATPYESTDGQFLPPSPPRNIYLRITNNGTDLLASYSFDGAGWKQLASTSLAGFIGSVDRIGLYGDSINTNVAPVATFSWFRVT